MFYICGKSFRNINNKHFQLIKSWFDLNKSLKFDKTMYVMNENLRKSWMEDIYERY